VEEARIQAFKLLLFVVFCSLLSCGTTQFEQWKQVVHQLSNAMAETTVVDPSASNATSRAVCANQLLPLFKSDVDFVLYGAITINSALVASEYFCITTVKYIGALAFETLHTDIVENTAGNGVWFQWLGNATFWTSNNYTLGPLAPYDVSRPDPAVAASFIGLLEFDNNNLIKKARIYVSDIIAVLGLSKLAFGDAIHQPDAPVPNAFIAFCIKARDACAPSNLGYGNPLLSFPEYLGACLSILAAQPAAFFATGSPVLQANNFLCRSGHSSMAYIDPVTHCPHVALNSTFCLLPPIDI